MAICFMDGFDGFTTVAQAGRRGINALNLDVKTTGGRFGGGAIQGMGGVGSINVPFTSISGDTVYLGWAQKQSNMAATMIWSLGRGSASRIQGATSNACMYLMIDTGGSSTVSIRNAAGAQIATFTLPFDGAWHWFDLKVVALSGTSGSFELRMDGNTVASATGVNMAGSSATGTQWSWNFGYSYAYQGDTSPYFDDLVIQDTSGTSNNSWVGDCRIATLLPDSVDAAGAWTANTGTLATALATHDDDTSYASSSTAADEFFVGVADLPVTPSSVRAVQATVIGRKTGTDGTTFTPEVKSGATVGSGASVSLGTSYWASKAIFPVDPATGAAWTAAAVNALKIGGKLS